MSSSPQYEFTQEQNRQISNLAGKMRFVGLFSLLFGLFALLITLLTVAFIYRDRLPAGFREKAKDYAQKAKENLPDDLKTQAEEYSLDKVPTDNHFLWGIAIFSGVTGAVFLLQGVWTRSSSESFQKIVDTQGRDISHLMSAIGSLQTMYGLIYLLLLGALLGGVIAVGLTLYQYFATR